MELNDRYEIKINSEIKQKWLEKTPKIFSSTADAIRSVFDEYIEGNLVHAESGITKTEIDTIIKKLEEIENNIIDEIKKTRSDIRSASALREEIKEANSEKIKQVRTRQLKKIWLEDTEITNIKTQEELLQHFNYEYDFLRKYAYDTLDMLEREGYLTLSRTGRITWNKDLLE